MPTADLYLPELYCWLTFPLSTEDTLEDRLVAGLLALDSDSLAAEEQEAA